MGMLHEYHDRKKAKWNGYYLSEHTRLTNEEKNKRHFVWPAKPVMTKEEIDRTLYEAKLKNKAIAIQKEAVNQENLYGPDIIGKINGYDELGIYLGAEKIDYDEIRSVEFHVEKKWFDLN